MKKNILLLFGILFFTTGIAQTLEYPKNNCASLRGKNENYATGDNYKSWCDFEKQTPYVRCQCEHGKKIKAYNNELENLNNQISSLVKNKRDKLNENQTLRQKISELEDLMGNNNTDNLFYAHRTQAIDLAQEILRNYQDIDQMEDERCALVKRKSTNAYCAKETSYKTSIDQTQNLINSLNSREPKKEIKIVLNDTAIPNQNKYSTNSSQNPNTPNSKQNDNSKKTEKKEEFDYEQWRHNQAVKEAERKKLETQKKLQDVTNIIAQGIKDGLIGSLQFTANFRTQASDDLLGPLSNTTYGLSIGLFPVNMNLEYGPAEKSIYDRASGDVFAVGLDAYFFKLLEISNNNYLLRLGVGGEFGVGDIEYTDESSFSSSIDTFEEDVTYYGAHISAILFEYVVLKYGFFGKFKGESNQFSSNPEEIEGDYSKISIGIRIPF